MSDKIVTRIGLPEDCLKIQSVVNEAFMADAFFKKEEYHLRFADGEVETMMNTNNSDWIIALLNNQIVGCIYLKWKINTTATNTNPPPGIQGHFSSVSVLDSMAKRGIGRTLVKAAEDHIINLSNSNSNNDNNNNCRNNVTIDCGVINLREDLFKWYEKQGYQRSGEEIKDDDEVNRITLDGMVVTLVILCKTLIE